MLCNTAGRRACIAHHFQMMCQAAVQQGRWTRHCMGAAGPSTTVAMLYSVYQSSDDLMAPLRLFADAARSMLQGPWEQFSRQLMGRHALATLEMMSRFRLSHHRPAYEVDGVTVGNQEVAVTEEPALVTPFGTLLHFRKDM